MKSFIQKCPAILSCLMAYCLLAFVAGCGGESPKVQTPAPVLKPPLFGKGDLVLVGEGGDRIGIIINVQLYDDENARPVVKFWGYSVMFHDLNLDYREPDLKLYKRAEWSMNQPPPIGEIQKTDKFP